MSGKRRPLTDEEKVQRRKAQEDFNEVVTAAAANLKRSSMYVRQCWGDIKHLSIGLVMNDQESIEAAQQIIDERFPGMDLETAVGLMKWVIRKIKNPRKCRDAFYTAMEEEGL